MMTFTALEFLCCALCRHQSHCPTVHVPSPCLPLCSCDGFRPKIDATHTGKKIRLKKFVLVLYSSLIFTRTNKRISGFRITVFRPRSHCVLATQRPLPSARMRERYTRRTSRDAHDATHAVRYARETGDSSDSVGDNTDGITSLSDISRQQLRYTSSASTLGYVFSSHTQQASDGERKQGRKQLQ